MSTKFSLTTVQTIIGALVVVGLGLLAYFRQKEYERMQQRYLSNGVDAFGEQVGYIFSVFFANYQRALWTIRLLRDTGRTIRRELLDETGFVQIEPRAFDQTAQYRVKELVGSSVFSDVYERVHARVGIANNFIIVELLNGIRYWVDPPVQGEAEFSEGWSRLSQQEVFDLGFEKLKEYNTEINSYFVLSAAIQALSRELARSRFSVRKIDRFQNNELVVQLKNDLQQIRQKIDEQDNDNDND